MNKSLNTFAVIHRLLAPLQRYERFLPGRLASFEASAPRHLAKKIRRAYFVDLHLEDRFDGALDLRLGRAPIHAERQKLPAILRLFFRHQRLLSNHR